MSRRVPGGGPASPRAISQLYDESREKSPSEEDIPVKESEKLDYFNFYHNDEMTQREKKMEDLYRKKDRDRQKKWMNMCDIGKGSDKWNNKFFKDGFAKEKLRRRIYKGIPKDMRCVVWPRLLRYEEAKDAYPVDSYKKLLHYAKSHAKCLDQIDKDIVRTFRNNYCFRENYGPRSRALFNVLAAYSVFNQDIEYCQGMNEIGGLLLMFIMDEEVAFWSLVQLMKGAKHHMHGVFVPGFPTLMRILQWHEKVLLKLEPALAKNLTRKEIPSNLYAFKWYMECFIGRVPTTLMFRLWDIFLLEGERVLIPIGMTILKLHKTKLMHTDVDNTIIFLQTGLTTDMGCTDNDFMTKLTDCLETLQRSDLLNLPPLNEEMRPKSVLGGILHHLPPTEEIWRMPQTGGDFRSLQSSNVVSPMIRLPQPSLRTVDNSSLLMNTNGIPAKASPGIALATRIITPPPNLTKAGTHQHSHLDDSLSMLSMSSSSQHQYIGAGAGSLIENPSPRHQLITGSLDLHNHLLLTDQSSLLSSSGFGSVSEPIVQSPPPNNPSSSITPQHQPQQITNTLSDSVLTVTRFGANEVTTVAAPDERTCGEGAESVPSTNHTDDLPYGYEPGDKILLVRSKSPPLAVETAPVKVLRKRVSRDHSQELEQQEEVNRSDVDEKPAGGPEGSQPEAMWITRPEQDAEARHSPLQTTLEYAVYSRDAPSHSDSSLEHTRRQPSGKVQEEDSTVMAEQKQVPPSKKPQQEQQNLKMLLPRRTAGKKPSLNRIDLYEDDQLMIMMSANNCVNASRQSYNSSNSTDSVNARHSQQMHSLPSRGQFFRQNSPLQFIPSPTAQATPTPPPPPRK